MTDVVEMTINIRYNSISDIWTATVFFAGDRKSERFNGLTLNHLLIRMADELKQEIKV